MTRSNERYTVLDAPQRSPEWRQSRTGVATASRAVDILGRLKTGLPNQAQQDYYTQLIVEILTGEPQDDIWQTVHQKRGIDCEQFAIRDVASLTGWDIDRPGFLMMRDCAAGCSPDGMVGTDTVVEVKVLKSTNHVKLIRDAGGLRGNVPAAYLPQARHLLWVTGADALEFAAWDDRFPKGLRIYRATLLARDAGLTEYDSAVRTFIDSVAAEAARLMDMSDNLEVSGYGI